MTNQNSVAPVDQSQASIMHDVMVKGDLEKLSPDQRAAYYAATCQSIGLNPFTKPFEFIKLNGKLVLYAQKGATDQLRGIHKISISKPDIQFQDGLVVVTVTGRDQSGREDTELGVVTLGNLQGDARANAIMKAVTKAKRRLTLSMCGLGMLDETETETIPNARRVSVDVESGEIIDAPAAPAPRPRAIAPDAIETAPATPPADNTTITEENLNKVRAKASERGIEGHDFDWLVWDKYGGKSPADLTVTEGRVLFAMIHSSTDDDLATLMTRVRKIANDHLNAQAAEQQ